MVESKQQQQQQQKDLLNSKSTGDQQEEEELVRDKVLGRIEPKDVGRIYSNLPTEVTGMGETTGGHLTGGMGGGNVQELNEIQLGDRRERSLLDENVDQDLNNEDVDLHPAPST